MTKKLLLPTPPERRRVRQELAERSPSAESLKAVALANRDTRPSQAVSDHNSNCEKSENELRISSWVEDQQLHDTKRLEDAQSAKRTPPPIPPRPKALFQNRDQTALTNTQHGGATADGKVAYPVLPPQCPVPDHHRPVPSLDSDEPGPVHCVSTCVKDFTCAGIANSGMPSPFSPIPPRQPTRESASPRSSSPHSKLLEEIRAYPAKHLKSPADYAANPAESIKRNLRSCPAARAALSAHSSSSPSPPPPKINNPFSSNNYRIFTDFSGKFKVLAHFVDFAYGHIHLLKFNGVKIRVALSKLSGEDIWWCFEEMERRRRLKPGTAEPKGPPLVGAISASEDREVLVSKDEDPWTLKAGGMAGIGIVEV